MANIDVSKSVVDVDIMVENSVLLPDAFNSIGFITKNDNSPRTITVNKLEDLLNNGFTRDSYAYNFCYGVFLQGRLNNIIVRSVRSGENYLDAYISDNNSNYYFTVIESKSVQDVVEFSEKVSGELKLIFFSSNQDYSDQLSNLDNVVFYYNTNLDVVNENGWLMFDSSDFVLFDDGSYADDSSESQPNPPSKVITCDATNNSGGYIIRKQSLSQGAGIENVQSAYLYLSIVDEYLNTVVPEIQISLSVREISHYTLDTLVIDLIDTYWGDGFDVDAQVQNTDQANYKLVKFRYEYNYVNSNSSLSKMTNNDSYVCLKPFFPT